MALSSSRAASENLMKQQEKMALERLQEHAAERDSLARWGKRDNHSRLASIFNSHSNSSRGHRGSMTEREAVTLLEVDGRLLVHAWLLVHKTCLILHSPT